MKKLVFTTRYRQSLDYHSQTVHQIPLPLYHRSSMLSFSIRAQHVDFLLLIFIETNLDF